MHHKNQKPIGRHLFRPRLPFWGPLAAILDFAGVAGGERVPPAPLGWYLDYKVFGPGTIVKKILIGIFQVLKFIRIILKLVWRILLILNYSAQVFIRTEYYCHSVSVVKIIGMLRGISKAKSIRGEVRRSSELGYVLTLNYVIKIISDSFPLLPSWSWWGWLTKLLKVKIRRVTLTISDFLSISGWVQEID